MSFSSTVKGQLCRIKNTKPLHTRAELSAVLGTAGIFQCRGNGINIKLSTENAAFARRIFLGIKHLFNTYPEIAIKKSKKLKKHTTYAINIFAETGTDRMLSFLDMQMVNIGSAKIDVMPTKELTDLMKEESAKRAFLRGAFLAGGSVSDPEKTYHLEITSHHKSYAHTINGIMNYYELNAKIIKRKGNCIVYLKEGENIVDFLNIIGAHSALLKLENIRIIKQMRNDVNRIVNCETANLEKTVNASVRQVENIKLIQKQKGLYSLPDNLREIALLRLEFPDANLKELGNMLNPPLGKSGVNHRLRKIDKLAEEILKD